VDITAKDGAGPEIVTANSFAGLTTIYITLSEPTANTLTTDGFVYVTVVAGDQPTITSVLAGSSNALWDVMLATALTATNIGPGADSIKTGVGVTDAAGNSANSARAVQITSDPDLAPASPSSGFSTTVLAGAAAGAAFLIVIVIIVSVVCCRRHRRKMMETTGAGVRIELKDLSPDEIMAKFDVNKDGVLDQKELNNLMEKIVVTDKTKDSLEQQTKQSSDLHISIK